VDDSCPVCDGESLGCFFGEDDGDDVDVVTPLTGADEPALA
jgi:hypothetical protein